MGFTAVFCECVIIYLFKVSRMETDSNPQAMASSGALLAEEKRLVFPGGGREAVGTWLQMSGAYKFLDLIIYMFGVFLWIRFQKI